MREGAEQAGRKLTDLELQMEVKVSFDHDRQRAIEDCGFWGALALTPEQKTGVEDPIEMQRLADALPAERAATRFIVSTDPDEHVAAIMRYVDLGFTNLIFHAPGPDQARFLRLYGEEILPRLRAHRDRMTELDPSHAVATGCGARCGGPATASPSTPAEAEVLLGARGDALRDLCESAGRVRDAGLLAAGRPGVITYSRKVFIPLTRLCRDRCHYCTFATTPNRLPAAYLSPDEILAIAEEGRAAGCKEALFTLGDRPEDRWPAGARVARRARLRRHARLRPGDGDHGARAHRPAAAPQPRRA